ncbi:hypothetical protein Ccrd_014300, partial [Cynara cardunculus var. scolymus]
MNVLRMPLQLNYFKEYQQRLSSVVGVKRAKELVNQALVLVSLGGNDFVNNYYLYPFSLRSQSSMLVDYVPYVISEYRNILVVQILIEKVKGWEKHMMVVDHPIPRRPVIEEGWWCNGEDGGDVVDDGVVSIFIFLYFGLVFGAEKSPTPKPKVETTKRAFFVFGDSLVDNGNNNFLATSARADSPPYGIDYPRQRIGIDLLLPYLDPTLTGQKLLNGANFASAGIGILNDTGVQFRLYELGARKVIVTGTGPLGCVPAILALRSKKGECAPDLQQAAELFNPQLVDMVNSLNKKLGNHVFVTVETNYLHMNFINNPKAF